MTSPSQPPPLRFTNVRVLRDTNAALAEIVAATQADSPLPEGEGGHRNEVFIRPATLSDADSVFELLQQFATSYTPVRAKFDEILPGLISSNAACVLVADDAGEIVGYALALRVPTFFANGPTWHLQEIMVDPARRNEGIGGKLLHAVIVHARDDNAVEVVLASRRAGGFYLKHGFTETASYYKLKLGDVAG